MAQGDGMFSMFMLMGIFVLFYIMLIRPQNKKANEHKAMMAKMKVGDEIVTTGGFVGKIATMNGEHYIKIKLADGVDAHIQRSAVQLILPKGTLKSL